MYRSLESMRPIGRVGMIQQRKGENLDWFGNIPGVLLLGVFKDELSYEQNLKRHRELLELILLRKDYHFIEVEGYYIDIEETIGVKVPISEYILYVFPNHESITLEEMDLLGKEVIEHFEIDTYTLLDANKVKISKSNYEDIIKSGFQCITKVNSDSKVPLSIREELRRITSQGMSRAMENNDEF